MLSSLVSKLKKSNDDPKVMYQFYKEKLKKAKVKNAEKIASKIRDTIQRIESKKPTKKK